MKVWGLFEDIHYDSYTLIGLYLSEESAKAAGSEAYKKVLERYEGFKKPRGWTPGISFEVEEWEVQE